MTKLALHGLCSLKDVQDLSEEDRSTYRRWARRSYAAYAIVLAVLFAGLWIHDRNMTKVTDQNHPLSTDAASDFRTPQILVGRSRLSNF